ncbi:MAG TPA: Fe-S cluster assembly protein SufD, partial [Paracoccus sp. (in: a-proteobacteria)]|nr:Fe-S cluster assembly protein SufD [Paracoccus sp. (in: a-proteobacteria)]
MGLPGARDEYWRYTNPAPFNAPTPEALAYTSRESSLFEGIDRLKLVFVDGVFDAAASDDLSGEGMQIEVLSADTGTAHWAADLYGKLETSGQNPVKRPFAALNTLAARDGVLIRVTGKVARPVHILYRRAAQAADVHVHHVIRLEPGAELTLLENGGIGARSNTVTEVEL